MNWKTRLLAWLLGTAVGLAGVVPAWAQETSPLKEKMDARVTKFLEGVSSGDAQGAFKELLQGSQLITQTEAVQALVTKTSRMQEQFGQCRGFEQVDAKQIASDLILMRYLYKCENFPVVWYFAFYHTPAPEELSAEIGTWRVITVRFDTRLEALAY